MKYIIFSCLSICIFLTYLIIFFTKDKKSNYSFDNPQCFHRGNISRLGGLAMSIATLIFFVVIIFIGIQNNIFNNFSKISISTLLIIIFVFLGIAEDFTQRISVKIRFFSTLILSGMACFYSDISINRLDIPIIDDFLIKYYFFGFLLAIFAMGGLPHAFNIIDGYNGLAGMVALTISFALLYVCVEVGEKDLATLICILIGVTLGFLLFNYPFGKIFAGDGGAYLWGGIISYVCVDLVANNAQVSAWFPIAALCYPVTETIFSIYRKKIQGKSPGEADAMHLHQLIYRRIKKEKISFENKKEDVILHRNYMTSPYLWGLNALAVIPSVIFWDNRNALVICCFVFVSMYVYIYLSLIRFKKIVSF